MGYHHLKKKWPNFIPIEVIGYKDPNSKNTNSHALLLIGRQTIGDVSVSNPATWGEHAVIIDPWLGTLNSKFNFFHVKSLASLKSYTDYLKGVFPIVDSNDSIFYTDFSSHSLVNRTFVDRFSSLLAHENLMAYYYNFAQLYDKQFKNQYSTLPAPKKHEYLGQLDQAIKDLINKGIVKLFNSRRNNDPMKKELMALRKQFVIYREVIESEKSLID